MDNISAPIIVQSNPNLTPTHSSGQLMQWLIKIVLLGLVLFVGFQAWQAYQLWKAPESVPAAAAPVLTETNGGRIRLISTKENYKVGEEVIISAVIDTNGRRVNGIDLMGSYDPGVLTATNSGRLRTFRPGNVFTEYPITLIDSTNGDIQISAIATLSQAAYSGNGQLATLTFLASQPGITTVRLNFKAGETTDSNMIDADELADILTSVQDVTIKIE